MRSAPVGPRSPLALSFVVPLHDEADNVAPLWSELRAVASGLGTSWEAVFVDDGSTDGTREQLAALDGPELRVVRLARRYGQTAALQAGFDAARGEVVVSLDGDLQNDPADVPRLLAELDRGYDVVCGWRRHRRDALLPRRLPSRLGNALAGALTGVRLHDHGCTLRAYRRSVLRRLRVYGEMHRFVTPWLALAGGRWTEIEVAHRARRRGRSKYGLSRAWKVAFDLLALAALQRFAGRPGLGLVLASLPFALLAVGFLAGGAATIFASGSGPLPFMLPSAAILCGFAAAHLLLLAVLAELVVRWASGGEQVAGRLGSREVS